MPFSLKPATLLLLLATPAQAQVGAAPQLPVAGHQGADSTATAAPLPTAIPAILQRLSTVPYLAVATADAHNGKTQLVSTRAMHTDGVDACRSEASKNTFLGAIEEGIRQASVDRVVETNPKIEELFGISPMTSPERQQVSLLSHPICLMDTPDIVSMLGERSVPAGSAYLDTLRKFSEASNRDRSKALDGDQAALKSFVHRWTQFMGCLSYAESMGTAENTASDRSFQKTIDEYPEAAAAFTNAAGQIKRPRGVLTTIDRDGAYYTAPRKLADLESSADPRWALKAAETFFVSKDLPPDEITVFNNRIFTKDVVLGGRVLAKAFEPLTEAKLADLKAAGVTSVPAGSTKGIGGELLEHFKAARETGASISAETHRLAKEFVKAAYPTWAVVGMYQFDPNAAGNVSPCILQWNKIHAANPSCFIDPASTAASLTALASGGQTFNAFCGVQKIVQSFNSQVNTSNLGGVAPANVKPDGTLRAPKDRCVSIVSQAGIGRVYSHFGPLRNSTHNNLAEVLSCAKRIAR
jgi:hypothetical protein